MSTDRRPEAGQFKGEPYRGLKAGWWYELWMLIGGWTPSFYRRAAETIPFEPGMKVLELGCGTASFSLAIAQRIQPDGVVHGVDLSPEQLAYARQKVQGSEAAIVFHQCSMDEAPFAPSSFDAVVSCLALAQVPADVRRKAIHGAAASLRPGGLLAMIEPSLPGFGYQSIFMAPFFTMIPDWRDLWYNRLARVCEEEGLQPHTDVYLTSFARCQIFVSS